MVFGASWSVWRRLAPPQPARNCSRPCTRPEVKEQVQYGREFLELDFKGGEGSGDGYVPRKVMSEAFIEAEMALFAARAKVDLSPP